MNFLNFQGTYLGHIFLPSHHKTIKKTAKSILLSADNGSFVKTTMWDISAFNCRHFRQPIRSCGIVLTANQLYSQNLAVTSTNVRAFVSGTILMVAVRENVWEPLKLGLISGSYRLGHASIEFFLDDVILPLHALMPIPEKPPVFSS